ncbi:hypothetical protein GGI25_002863 [Coemansia spiralis]|uniref:Uncharacterized protein n=2 Tax=Coemansia TaxID=4863 RepID=A0A9W8G821_9FUNG|nr:hypothetical protein BX070DRAFT_251598 [Coemansia spiralis]KAJ1992337.1 hypothetical protein EDC05_002835 [Coemansia umbellata]KAJ2622281.1 hypothetical protein GGI26_003434 [Coemansia sp. RSA 1358]KAJ2677765.1 hypothetical protein GGI25_002863 [Coemansia spiralis]
MDLQRRATYNKVGDYLYSQDLCVGVFDGTDFNSGTCERSSLTSSDPEFPVSRTIIRYNMVEPSTAYISNVLQNLTLDTQAQCVMTNDTATACWIWNMGFSECLGRYYYKDVGFVDSDGCTRTSPVDGSYAVNVRMAGSDPSSSSSSAPCLRSKNRKTLKAAMVTCILAISALIA